eukprot:m.7220 g.7220  ORF g.7220 m.7220 type:complete len:1021 (+) comp18072_c0_seq1:161-3223(+)
MSEEDRDVHPERREEEPNQEAVKESLVSLCNDDWFSFAEALCFTASAIAFILQFPKQQGLQGDSPADPVNLLKEALLKLYVGALDATRSAFLLKKPRAAIALFMALQPKGTHPPEDENDFCRFYAEQSSRCERKAGIMKWEVIRSHVAGLSPQSRCKLLDALPPTDCETDQGPIDKLCCRLTRLTLRQYMMKIHDAGDADIYRKVVMNDCFNLPWRDAVDLQRVLQMPNEFLLPPFIDKNFFGRADDLAEVKKFLEQYGSVVVHGERGMGKTSLVLNVVHDMKDKYDMVLWIDAFDKATLNLSLSELAKKVAAPLSGNTFAEMRETTKLWLLKVAEKHSKILVVLDGVNDKHTLKDVADFPPRLDPPEKMHLLVTSTFEMKKMDLEALLNPKNYHLTKLKDEDVRVGLCNSCPGQPTEKQLEAAASLAPYIDGNPLLLTLVISFVNSEKITLESYYQHVRSQSTSSHLHGYEEHIFKTISNMKSQTVQRIVEMMPFCDTASFPADLFSYDFDILNGDQEEETATPKENDDRPRSRCPSTSAAVLYQIAFNRLSSYRLVEWKDPDVYVRKTLVMHPVIAKKLLKRQSTKEQIDHIKSLCKLFSRAFSACMDEKNEWQNYSRLYPPVQRCLVHMDRLGIIDEDLFLQYGRIESLLGDNRLAKKLLEKCLKKSQNYDYDLRMDAYRYLAAAERRLGRLSEALTCVKRGQKELEGKCTAQSKDYSDLLKEVEAEIMMDAGDYGGAWTCLQDIEGVDSRREEDGLSLSVFSDLARCYLGLKNFREAARLYTKAQDKSQGGYRHNLYTAYRHVSQALSIESELQDIVLSADLEPFAEEVRQCDNIVGKMKHSQHRYYAWICRSVARLKLTHAQLLRHLPEENDVEQTLVEALEMVRACLECHLAISSRFHQKVGKACELVGDVCSEWIKLSDLDDKGVIECGLRFFELAVEILESSSLKGFEQINKKVRKIGNKIEEIKTGGLRRFAGTVVRERFIHSHTSRNEIFGILLNLSGKIREQEEGYENE